MRPTFMGFETARRGLNVSQKGLDIVGNNLSNIDTPGYTRQRMEIASIAPSSFSSKVASSRIGLAGQGVEALGISQTRDSFLDKRFRDEYSDASYYSQSSSILSDLQSALGDAKNVAEGGDVFMSALQQVYEALTDFTGNNTSVPHANLVLSSFNNMTQVLQSLDSKVKGVADQQTYDLGINVNRVNDIFARVAHLNDAISKDATVLADSSNECFRPNELLDERNLLLDELASYGNISVKELNDGSTSVTFAGKEVISGNKYDGIGLSTDETTNVVSLSWKSTGEALNLSGGALKGYTDFLNGRGANIQNPGETNKQGVLYYKDRLDTMARTIANVVNHVIPDMEEIKEGDADYVADSPIKMRIKRDNNGNIVYKELISAKQSDNTTDIDKPVTAGNISVSDKWTLGGSSYFISDPGSKDNSYYQQLRDLLYTSKIDFVSYGEQFTGTFDEYLMDYTGKIGADTAFYQGRHEVTAAVSNDFLDRRDEVSGVSESEETTNMLTFQKSFSAVSRLMTTMDDLLEVLINRTGRAGL